jgi:MFS family permease
LRETQEYFKIDDSLAGLLQTVFICSYMLLAPLFGYLGDRYQRKWIIVFGVSFWSLMTFLGSFVPADVNIFIYLKIFKNYKYIF